MYLLPSDPRISVKKSFKKPIHVSNMSCFFPGFSTFRLRTRMTARSVNTTIIIHVTTTDSPIGIPPKTGTVNTVSQFSSSVIRSANSFVEHPPFLCKCTFNLLLSNFFLTHYCSFFHLSIFPLFFQIPSNHVIFSCYFLLFFTLNSNIIAGIYTL